MKVCSVDVCEKEAWARGWCGTHYRRWRKHGDVGADVPVRGANRTETCEVDGCDLPTNAVRWCKNHYYRFKKYGDPLAGQPAPMSFPESLLRRMMFMPNGCIEYTGCRDEKGYGRMSVNGRRALAHRASYELVRGPIPSGLQIDHLCRNTSCVHPGHMEPVTVQENLRRRDVAA